jgi:hypothetical protein
MMPGFHYTECLISSVSLRERERERESQVLPITGHEGPCGGAVDRGGWLTPRPGRFTSEKETRYPLYRQMGGPRGRSGRVREISPRPKFEPRIVQPVASRYTDWAILAAVQSHSQHYPFLLQVVSTTRDGWHERCTVYEVESVLLHACGLSQRHTAKELHHHHPNRLWSGHQSIGRIYSRFQEDGSVLDKPRAGRMTIVVGCTCQDRGNEVSSGKSPQVTRMHSAHFSKPVRGSSKMQKVAATIAASGADSERCDA